MDQRQLNLQNALNSCKLTYYVPKWIALNLWGIIFFILIWRVGDIMSTFQIKAITDVNGVTIKSPSLLH